MSNNCDEDNGSIKNNDNSVFSGNDKKSSSVIFNEGLSAVRKEDNLIFLEIYKTTRRNYWIS